MVESLELNNQLIPSLQEFIVMNVSPTQETVCITTEPASENAPALLAATTNVELTTSVNTTESINYMSWSTNLTKTLIDLYQKHKEKVGTLQVRTMKRLWELIAGQLNSTFNINISSSNCENKWRVLERGYKKYCDNKTQTGRGRKCFEFAEEMDKIFQKKRNVHPEILLSSETITPTTEIRQIVAPAVLPSTSSENLGDTIEMNTPKKRRNLLANRHRLLESIRQDKREYQKARLEIARERIQIEKQKLEEMKKRNQLIEERNRLYREAKKN